MTLVETIYPALTVACAVLLVSGVVLLVAPWSLPSAVADLRTRSRWAGCCRM